MRIGIARTEESRRALQISGMSEIGPRRSYQAPGESNQPGVFPWVSGDKFGRETGPLRKSANHDAVAGYAGIDCQLDRRFDLSERGGQPGFVLRDRRQK